MHDQWLRKAQLSLGRMLLRTARFRFTRYMPAGPISRLIAYLIVEKETMGVVKGRKEDVLDIAENWLKIPTFMRFQYRIAEAMDERVVIEWPECAVGFTDPLCLEACRASCNIYVETVRRLGGRPVVTDNILEGAPLCGFVITRLQTPDRR